jgi:hypothetical protein
MKKYYIILGIILVLLTVSFIYKANISKNIFKNFPSDTDEKNTNDENKFRIYMFFNKNTCKSCMEVIEVLNGLPEQFKVYGVVPGPELKNELDLRNRTGVNFDLLSIKKFRKFRPLYLPSLLGVFGGEIYFLIPATSGTKDDIFNLLMSFYYAATPIFYK